jgi:hypothetical protein
LPTQSAKTIFPNKQPLVRPAIRETTSTRGNQTTAKSLQTAYSKKQKEMELKNIKKLPKQMQNHF